MSVQAANPGPEPGPRRGDEISVKITGIDPRGRGVGSAAGHEIRVPGALPGQDVWVRVLRRRKGRLVGHLLRVLEEGPDAVAAPCAHFGVCGGCSFQSLDYAAQLGLLHAMVESALGDAGLGEVPVAAVLGAEHPYGYRNKMDFTFSSRRWVEAHEPEGVDRAFALGLHPKGRFQKVLDIDACHIQFPEANGILADARRIARELDLAPWDIQSHEGLLRHLVLRKGVATGDIMVDLVTSEVAPAAIGPWVRALLEAHPEVTTLVQNVTGRLSVVAVGEEEIVHHGPGYIHERLLGLTFRVSANSFFQTNTVQAERLFAQLLSVSGVRESDTVFDLYCGAGSLTLAFAPRAARVIGFEVVPQAVADARTNAGLNGIGNVTFVEGDVLASINPGGGTALPAPDLVVVDPPRPGLHPKVLAGLLELSPPRIAYVSCNIHTAAPQVAALVREGGYDVETAQPVDLFPHTPHVETLLVLRR